MFADSVAARSRTANHDGASKSRSGCLFYEFSLERHVPADHLLRSIDRFVDLGELRRELAPFYSRLGRPSIDPELMIRHADRRLLLRHPLRAAAVRGSPPEPRVPLVLPARPGRRGAGSLDVLQEPAWPFPRQRSAAARVRDRCCERCMREGLVGGEGFAVDASLVKADANRQKGIEGEIGLPPETTAEPSRNIWRCSTMRPSAQRPRSRPSSYHRPIRRRAGPGPVAGRPSSPIRPTT